jgi:hypothetical protein
MSTPIPYPSSSIGGTPYHNKDLSVRNKSFPEGLNLQTTLESMFLKKNCYAGLNFPNHNF